ncbi:hypothetical protein FNV43_RR10389 [Rhamnella rubrinervis]|uniref:Uncharacterized protein n=1 Tax=Rhamnella rubrinervis TaxID=2594499 RepID=A0A8K0HCJ9_9ROSA|nr:hypothetical protein FNV43_RR10389 [Rhamnella rubrinervis]
MGIITKKVTLSLLLVAMVFMATFVSPAVGKCEAATANEGSVATTGKELSLPRSILEELELRRNDGCSGSSCNILNDPCCSGCTCLPVGILVGVCVGGCC